MDANVLIALLEDPTPRGERAAALIDAIEAGDIEGVAASIVLTEVLAGFARDGDAARFELVADELTSLRLRYVPISPEIAIDAAWLRSGRTIRFPDAIHLAAARSVGATALVTSDRRVPSVPKVEVVQLDDLPGAPETGSSPEV